MRLADKVTGLLVIVLAISIALNFAVFRIVIFRGFIQMEDERAVQDMDRCREALKREIDGVRMLAIDWAQWDDSYRFVADGNPEYTEANLLLKSFKDNSLSLIAYYTISNTLVWGQCYDLDTGEEIHLREFAGTTLPDHSALVSYPQTQPAVAGILMTDRGPMLVASATILTSEGLGPPRGHLIMGRFLDAALVKALGERVNLALDIFPIPGGKVPDSVRGIVAQLPAAGAAHIEKKDARRLLVYAIITDINNAPAILLRTTVVREINARARATQHYVSIALLVAGLLILVVIIRLMRVLVVGPISWLTQTVLAVRESARTGLGIHRKIALRRNDEIGVLSREFENTIQEWDAARTRAEQASQAKSDFLTFISHELRTPLNGIMGLAELIANAKSLESNRERARTIIDESESLVNLINELLDTARIEAGKLELESVPFDPAALVEKIVSVMSVRALKKGLGFDVRLDPKLPAELIGDPGRIRQVIVNLAGNSLKFTEQGSVSLGISVLEDLGQRVKLRFEVVDTGIGIPREKQEAIFERFVQADRNIAVRYGGTGLGMSISRDLVRLMGGEIGVDSEVGRGSTFWFQLVLRKGTGTRHGEEPGAANQPAPYETGRTGHILLVDDYATNREVAMSHLFAAGYTIETAENGLEAIAAAERHRFDLILMDVEMPEMNGCEATRRIRAGNSPNRQTPILAMTAYVSGVTREECLAAGMNGVITKPIRRKALLAEVDRRIRRARGEASAGETQTGARPAATGAAQQAEPIQWDQAVAEFLGDEKEVERLLRSFLDAGAEQLVRMKEAMNKGHFAQLAREAHSIKGAATNLTAAPLADAAAALEKVARAGSGSECPAAFDKMVVEFDRLRRHVQTRVPPGEKDWLQ